MLKLYRDCVNIKLICFFCKSINLNEVRSWGAVASVCNSSNFIFSNTHLDLYGGPLILLTLSLDQFLLEYTKFLKLPCLFFIFDDCIYLIGGSIVVLPRFLVLFRNPAISLLVLFFIYGFDRLYL